MSRWNKDIRPRSLKPDVCHRWRCRLNDLGTESNVEEQLDVVLCSREVSYIPWSWPRPSRHEPLCSLLALSLDREDELALVSSLTGFPFPVPSCVPLPTFAAPPPTCSATPASRLPALVNYGEARMRTSCWCPRRNGGGSRNVLGEALFVGHRQRSQWRKLGRRSTWTVCVRYHDASGCEAPAPKTCMSLAWRRISGLVA